jgi:hypothetical protein
MRKYLIAAAAVVTLAMSAAPSFAVDRGDSGSNVDNQCYNILASKDGHPQADVRYCENHT